MLILFNNHPIKVLIIYSINNLIKYKFEKLKFFYTLYVFSKNMKLLSYLLLALLVGIPLISGITVSPYGLDGKLSPYWQYPPKSEKIDMVDRKIHEILNDMSDDFCNDDSCDRNSILRVISRDDIAPTLIHNKMMKSYGYGVGPVQPFAPSNIWSATPFTSRGTFTGHITVPGIPIPDTKSPALVAVDPVNSRFFVDLTVSQQYTFSNGTYTLISAVPGLCFFSPQSGYAVEVNDYLSALNQGAAFLINETRVVNEYFGQVLDAGSCECLIGVTLDTDIIFNGLVRWEFAQSAPTAVNATSGQCPSSVGQTKVNGIVSTPFLLLGQPSPALFQLPPQCFGPTLLPYCQSFCFPYCK